MIHEQVFICWHENQNEGDARELKAPTIRSAAKKAVDIWRHENVQELAGHKVTVYVKDEARRVHQVVVTSGRGDEQAPGAFA
jgi:hypothetical protein